jgi:hypothetical protein
VCFLEPCDGALAGAWPRLRVRVRVRVRVKVKVKVRVRVRCPVSSL